MQAAPSIMFLALLGAHVALRVEPRLLTFADELLIPGRWPLLYAFPAFSFDAAFLWDHLGSPGGAASYAGAFGSQLYGLPGAGPALLTGLCAAVLLAGGGVLTGLGAGRGSAARYVPPLLLLALLNQYAFRLADLLAFTAALSALLVLGTRPSRGAAGLLAVPVLYLLVGAPALLLPVVGGLRAAQSGRWLLAGACAAAAGLVPLLLGMGLLGVEPLLAYTALTVFQPGSRPVDLVLWGALYGFFVAATLVLAWRRRGRAAEGRRFGRAGAVVRAAVVLAAGAAVALSTYAGDVGALLRVNHRARLRDWPGVLEAARGLPKDWYLGHIGRDVNRALYGTGQLLDRMFAFPQAPEALLPDVEQDEPYKTGAEILLELGAVNQAEHLALESLEMRGARPLLLALLTRIYLAKGLPEAARVFLGALARDVVHAPWAARTRRLLAADPTGSTDELVRRARARRRATEHAESSTVEITLLQLLVTNVDNRMALEYMLALHLLTDRPDKVLPYVRLLRGPGESPLPRHVAEAVVLASPDLDDPVEAQRLGIGQVTFERGRRYRRLVEEHTGDLATTVRTLAEEMPDSYFRYFAEGGGEGALE